MKILGLAVTFFIVGIVISYFSWQGGYKQASEHYLELLNELRESMISGKSWNE